MVKIILLAALLLLPFVSGCRRQVGTNEAQFAIRLIPPRAGTVHIEGMGLNETYIIK